MLLALNDDKGTLAMGACWQQAVGGAILSELLLTGRLAVEKEKKKSFARVVDPTPLGDPVLDECLQMVRDRKKRHQLGPWVSRFANVKHLWKRVTAQLCRRGILREDEGRVLLLFKRKVYPEVDPAPERAIVARLRKAIFTSSHDLDPRTVVLVALAHHAGLLHGCFDKKRLKERKKRIETITSGDVAAAATKEAIEAVQAAVMVAVIMPAVMSTTVTSSG